MASELRAVFGRVLSSSAFVLGEEVEAFEHAWAEACGTTHCVGVGSGTAALTLLLQAAGIGPGDEVIVPAHTFFATAAAVLIAGAVPVLSDVEEATGLLDLEAAGEVVTPRTAAVLPVHLYGQMCELDRIAAFAERHGLAVVEDAAHAHGAQRSGVRPGARGAGAAFSFYPAKNLGALGDGGAVCTNDAALAERLRRLRNLGQRAKGEHVELAGNERLDGLQAALLRAKLGRLEHNNALRLRHAAAYRDSLHGHVRILDERPPGECVYHVFPVRVDDRDDVATRMRADGIDVAVHYTPPLHGQPALRDRVRTPMPLPQAEAWAATELSLPMSPGLTAGEVARAAAACRAALDSTADAG
jgi:dTDP-3-amino-3,4,6-trideoxy-alpha-D-glucose transaminase